ncbi:hypothetical protein [Actinomadura fulvescens]
MNVQPQAQPRAAHDHATASSSPATAETLNVFYQVERAGQIRLSDGGGPFGFDVTVALLVDELMNLYDLDAICETGCFLGDTTTYLTRRYPRTPVYTCDVDAEHAAVTTHRVAEHWNATVMHGPSPDLVGKVLAEFTRPLFFLDAHWAESWPLREELELILDGTAVALIHDFDIGHPRFSYDSYGGVDCGPDLLAALPTPPEHYFTPDPNARHALPCLQTGRRAGLGIVASGLDTTPLHEHPRLLTHSLPKGR